MTEVSRCPYPYPRLPLLVSVPLSPLRRTAVDADQRAGDTCPGVAREQRGDRRDLLHRGDLLRGGVLGEAAQPSLVADALGLGGGRPRGTHQVGVDGAGTDGVAGDALSAVLEGGRLGEPVDGVFVG